MSPATQAPPAQQPPGQLTPSHTQAPSRQRCPAPHAGPPPHTHAPAAEQVLAVSGSHATQVPPGAPQWPNARGRQKPPAQQPSGQDEASQAPDVSSWQASEHPSPDTALPSSHPSIPARTALSPQMAGAPSVSATFASLARSTRTDSWADPTIVAPARPSTRNSTVFPARVSGRRITAVSRPLCRGPRGIGQGAGREGGRAVDRARDRERRRLQRGVVRDRDLEAGQPRLRHGLVALAAQRGSARQHEHQGREPARRHPARRHQRLSRVPTVPIGGTTVVSPDA